MAGVERGEISPELVIIEEALNKIVDAVCQRLVRYDREPEDARAMKLMRFQKLQLPTFKGKPDPRAADQWLKQIVKILDVLEVVDDQRVLLATYMFEGEADYWWDFVKRSREANQPIISWKEFEEYFKEKFFPESVRDQLIEKFLELKQDFLSVAQYESKFAELSRHASYLVETESRRAKRFQQGLKPKIR